MSELVSWCLKPSQLQRITSGLEQVSEEVSECSSVSVLLYWTIITPYLPACMLMYLDSRGAGGCILATKISMSMLKATCMSIMRFLRLGWQTKKISG